MSPTGARPRRPAARASATTGPHASPPSAPGALPEDLEGEAPVEVRIAKRAVTWPDDDSSVLVTGICGRLGRLLARRLHREGRVVGIDRRPFLGRPKDIAHHQFDVRRKKTKDVFRAGGISAVVHLGVMHDPRASEREHFTWNVVAFQKLLEYMTQYSVPKLVVLSSASVYGPQPENAQFLTEEAPLAGAQHFSGIRDLITLDMLAQSFFWRHPDTETVVLRPVHILGGVQNAPSNYLRLARPWTLLGFDPMVQIIHEADVVDAIRAAMRPGVRGIFNIAGPGEVPVSRILDVLQRKRLSVPHVVAEPLLKRLFKWRLTSYPAPEIDHVRYVCMVDDNRARTILGWEPRRSLRETIMAVDTEG